MFKKKLLTSSFLVISTLSCAKPYQSTPSQYPSSDRRDDDSPSPYNQDPSSDKSGRSPYETALNELNILQNISVNIAKHTDENISIIDNLLNNNHGNQENFNILKNNFNNIKKHNSMLSSPYDNMPKESNEDTKQRIIAGMPCLIIVMQQYSLVLKTEIVEVTQKNSFSFMQDSNLGNYLSTISKNNAILKSNMTQFETELQYLASKYPSNSSCNTPPTPSGHEQITDEKEEKIKTLEGRLTEEIAALTAKAAYEIKVEAIKVINNKLSDYNQRSATDLKNEHIKKLKDILKEPMTPNELNKLTEEIAKKEKTHPNKVKKELITILTESRDDILNSHEEELKQEALNLLKERLKFIQNTHVPEKPEDITKVNDTKDGNMSTTINTEKRHPEIGHEEIADDEEITKDGDISTTIRPEDILFRSLLPLVNEIRGLLFNNLETFENLKDALISHQQNNTLYIITDLRKVIDFFNSYSYYGNSQNLILAREYNEAYLAMDIDGNNHNDCLNTMRNSLSELKKNLDKLMNDYDKIDQEVISNLKNELLNNPNINSETDIINKIQALDNIQLNAKLEELSRLLESAL